MVEAGSEHVRQRLEGTDVAAEVAAVVAFAAAADPGRPFQTLALALALGEFRLLALQLGRQLEDLCLHAFDGLFARCFELRNLWIFLAVWRCKKADTVAVAEFAEDFLRDFFDLKAVLFQNAIREGLHSGLMQLPDKTMTAREAQIQIEQMLRILGPGVIGRTKSEQLDPIISRTFASATSA